MKLSVLTGLILVFVYSCSEIEKDCMCTQEFRGYAVVVTDTLGVPADSLSVTIKDQNGNVLDVEQEQFDPEDGKYTVLTDSFTQLFVPVKLLGKFIFRQQMETELHTGNLCSIQMNVNVTLIKYQAPTR